MNLIQALKAGRHVRRPIAKHWGSSKTGWLSSEYLISLLTAEEVQFSGSYNQKVVNSVDLMAEDWEAKNDST